MDSDNMIVTIKKIDKYGFFINTKADIPKNLAEMVYGLNKMCNDGIFKYKPHLETKRNIFTIAIKTNDVDKNIINQVKNIAIKKNCHVEIDSCFNWLCISNEKENIDKYFD